MDEHRGLWATSKQLPIIKKELRLMVPSLTYIDVRRHRIQIYEAISRELLEDGCNECVEHFERLANMENYLFDMRIIKSRLLQTKGLLEAIIDNARIAERNCKILKNHSLALKTLFQTAMLLDRREGNEYNWLTKEMYLIVNHFIEKWSKRWKFPEIECRSRYYFGKFLLLKDHNYLEAIEQLKKALELSKSKQWYTAKDTYNFLSTKTRVYLCKSYLCEAARVQKKEKILAEELATNAIMAVWEGRLPKDVKLYCEACLRKGFYAIGSKHFEKTITLYKKVQPYIYSLMLPQFKCEMLLHQGICYLNLGNDSLALRKLKQSIRLGEIYNLKEFHAHALVQIGKLYSKSHNTYNLAQKSFTNARKIYTELNDENNTKKVNYLAAKLKSLQILPNLLNLIFGTDDNFCDLLTLRAWKDNLEIFWKDEHFDDNDTDDDDDDDKDEFINVVDKDHVKNVDEYKLKDGDINIQSMGEATDSKSIDYSVAGIEVLSELFETTRLGQEKKNEDVHIPQETEQIYKDKEKPKEVVEKVEMKEKELVTKSLEILKEPEEVKEITEEHKEIEENEDVEQVDEENDEDDEKDNEPDQDNDNDDDRTPHLCIFKRMP